MKTNNIENNGKSTGGVTGKGFLPGKSGNPGGRPKGLAEFVRASTKDGKALVEIMLSIANGKLIISGRKPSHRDIISAIEWLADRGFGKCETRFKITDDDEAQVHIEDMSPEESRRDMIRRGEMTPDGRLIPKYGPNGGPFYVPLSANLRAGQA